MAENMSKKMAKNENNNDGLWRIGDELDFLEDYYEWEGIKMREHKYRAWDVDQSLMFTPTQLQFEGTEILCWYQRSQVSDDGRWLQGCYLMQYTGLKDKNGKEIYEGDIVEMNCGFRSQIRFSKKHAAFYCCSIEEDLRPDLGLNDYALKIIGNIHENPELLGKEK